MPFLELFKRCKGNAFRIRVMDLIFLAPENGGRYDENEIEVQERVKPEYGIISELGSRPHCKTPLPKIHLREGMLREEVTSNA